MYIYMDTIHVFINTYVCNNKITRGGEFVDGYSRTRDGCCVVKEGAQGETRGVRKKTEHTDTGTPFTELRINVDVQSRCEQRDHETFQIPDFLLVRGSHVTFPLEYHWLGNATSLKEIFERMPARQRKTSLTLTSLPISFNNNLFVLNNLIVFPEIHAVRGVCNECKHWCDRGQLPTIPTLKMAESRVHERERNSLINEYPSFFLSRAPRFIVFLNFINFLLIIILTSFTFIALLYCDDRYRGKGWGQRARGRVHYFARSRGSSHAPRVGKDEEQESMEWGRKIGLLRNEPLHTIMAGECTLYESIDVYRSVYICYRTCTRPALDP